MTSISQNPLPTAAPLPLKTMPQPEKPSQPSATPSNGATPASTRNISLSIQEKSLANDGNLTALRQVFSYELAPGKHETVRDTLTLETSNTSDNIHISNLPGGRIRAEVNGKFYIFDVRKDERDAPTHLHIKSNGGNDKITIDPDVMLSIKVEAGDGDDEVQAGGGRTQLFGGQGDDTLRLGSGTGYAEGNDGDDTMIGGSGHTVMYGNNGADRMYAGAGTAQKRSYLDGGSGADTMYAGDGHTVMNGGRDDDLMVGHGRTTFYTGHGKNTVWSGNKHDLIYMNAGDSIKNDQGAPRHLVKPSQAGKQGYSVEGSPEFKQRVEDDFELMRGSPRGQKMLEEMDAAAQRNGESVKIVEAREQNPNEYNKSDLVDIPQDEHGNDIPDMETPVSTYIHNGARTAPAIDAEITYNRSHIHDAKHYFAAPLTQLHHEMAHSYNGATGSMLKGETLEQVEGKPAALVPNRERQVLGLPSDVQPFDFDNDPATPPTTFNPTPFTENGLNEEMGTPLRTSYKG